MGSIKTLKFYFQNWEQTALELVNNNNIDIDININNILKYT